MKSRLLDNIVANIDRFSDRNAFYINDCHYSYLELSNKVAGIVESIKHIPPQTPVGVITTDTLETYASIIALWINELILVPISPANAPERNENIAQQATIQFLLVPNKESKLPINTTGKTLIFTKQLTSTKTLINKNTASSNVLYLLFTSGSTGKPKGVPISQKNLDAFIQSFLAIGYELNEQDKFLQIYDLSFDASVHCYVLPLFLGACAYTVPTDEIKYLYAYRLMKEQELTFIKMPPSTLTYLQPYFSKINLEKLRYTLFGGEALPLNLANKWSQCAPHSAINNVYGPTEATINCFYYNLNNKVKQFNNVVSIGKPFGDTIALVLNENQTILPANQKGELCISGNQITTGYWENLQKNTDQFIEITYQNQRLLFYKTGDVVYYDHDGDYFFCERLDHQVQIQGHRVELGELEHHARNLTQLNHVAAISYQENGITQLILFLENYNGEIEALEEKLSPLIPSYMIPNKIINLPNFPHSVGGKIDRNALKKQLQ